MRIHSVNADQTVGDIAKEYGVDEDILRINNGIESTEPAVGEELLVLTPTRTYTVRRGDSTERLALRFGVRRRELAKMNPHIECEGLVPGRRLALRYDERKYGMAAANGYFYSGGTIDGLRQRLPYLTYVTVAAARIDGGGLRKSFEPRDAVGIIRASDKIPLLRIYDKIGATRQKDGIPLIDGMIGLAIDGGYKGITLGGAPCEEFLVELRRRLIGSDLILITEVDEGSLSYVAEYADGCIFTCSENEGEPCGFDEWEGAAYRKFATESESSRCMIELPVFARGERGYMPISEAQTLARRGGCVIEPIGDTGELGFVHKKHGKITYPSLKKIIATLDALHEYGYMGISFDIMRTPISYLMAFNALFGTSAYTSARASEGCSRGG